MGNFNPIRKTQSQIESTPIVDGQLLFVTDQNAGRNSIYLDVGTERKEIGRFDWSQITNKPFTSIGTGLNVTVDGELEMTEMWNNITDKPFATIGSGLLVVNNTLTADVQTWNQIANKPFESIGVGLTVNNGALIATGGGTGVDWSTEVINKPFETIGSGLKVENGALETDITIGWTSVESKPFETVGGGLIVVNNALTTSLAWSDITSKPFNTIGNTLSVVDGVLNVGTIEWNDVSNKPFVTIGSGLNISNNILTADIKTVTAPTSGTASASATSFQTLTVNNSVNTEINGTKYMEYSQTLSTINNTVYTFSNADITTNSVIEVFTDKFGLIPTDVSVSQNGQCTVTFAPQSLASTVLCRIYIR